MNKSIEKILVDIIKHELNLPDNYGKTPTGDVIPTVIIFGQNIKLFNTDKLQITVKALNTSLYSNRSNIIDNNGKFEQIQDINISQMIQIDCYSRNNEARERYLEIPIALNSIYAHQQMDLYNFKIGTIANAINITGIDGGSDINRFTITFNVISFMQKITKIDYYDTFINTIETEKEKI